MCKVQIVPTFFTGLSKSLFPNPSTKCGSFLHEDDNFTPASAGLITFE
jgi:hypothetical protein